MSNHVDPADKTEEAFKVEFSNYCSDGPGYCGTLIYNITGDKILLTESDVLTWKLPDRLPQVIHARDYQDKDFSLVEENLCPEDRDYLLDADGSLCIEFSRVKVLEFADGKIGFFMVHGEACYFTVVHGNRRYSFNEDDVEMY